eukprot:Cvel_10909.t1-p1 / transcript=Cvel_10909.t1 / gene=Cvel_10909 / organism=Chromera_velia_CCMP2878 / gene_product=hypothetical protein / transcript_product=hypothetical protein / location=Cvel_scaffold669:57099-73272(+) / protein_length=1370 / sequence_SO=supercontig / SO=protein_coding / is_pseudo=false
MATHPNASNFRRALRPDVVSRCRALVASRAIARPRWLQWVERAPPLPLRNLHVEAPHGRIVHNSYPYIVSRILKKWPDLRFHDCYVKGNEWHPGADRYRGDHPVSQIAVRALRCINQKERGAGEKSSCGTSGNTGDVGRAIRAAAAGLKMRRVMQEREQKILMATARESGREVKPLYTTAQAYLLDAMAERERAALTEIRNKLRLTSIRRRHSAIFAGRVKKREGGDSQKIGIWSFGSAVEEGERVEEEFGGCGDEKRDLEKMSEGVRDRAEETREGRRRRQPYSQMKENTRDTREDLSASQTSPPEDQSRPISRLEEIPKLPEGLEISIQKWRAVCVVLSKAESIKVPWWMFRSLLEREEGKGDVLSGLSEFSEDDLEMLWGEGKGKSGTQGHLRLVPVFADSSVGEEALNFVDVVRGASGAVESSLDPNSDSLCGCWKALGLEEEWLEGNERALSHSVRLIENESGKTQADSQWWKEVAVQERQGVTDAHVWTGNLGKLREPSSALSFLQRGLAFRPRSLRNWNAAVSSLVRSERQLLGAVVDMLQVEEAFEGDWEHSQREHRRRSQKRRVMPTKEGKEHWRPQVEKREGHKQKRAADLVLRVLLALFPQRLARPPAPPSPWKGEGVQIDVGAKSGEQTSERQADARIVRESERALQIERMREFWRSATQEIKEMGRNLVLVPCDKAPHNCVLICKSLYRQILERETLSEASNFTHMGEEEWASNESWVSGELRGLFLVGGETRKDSDKGVDESGASLKGRECGMKVDRSGDGHSEELELFHKGREKTRTNTALLQSSCTEHGKRGLNGVAYVYWLPKMHKGRFFGCRLITAAHRSRTALASRVLSKCLAFMWETEVRRGRTDLTGRLERTTLQQPQSRSGFGIDSFEEVLSDLSRLSSRLATFDLPKSTKGEAEEWNFKSGLGRSTQGIEGSEREQDLRQPSEVPRILSFDVEQLYSSIPHEDLIERVGEVLSRFWKKRDGYTLEVGLGPEGQNVTSVVWTTDARGPMEGPRAAVAHRTLFVSQESLLRLLSLILRDASVEALGGRVRARQKKGIPTGTPAGPQLANFYLLAYELRALDKLAAAKGPQAILMFRWTYRFIDDLLCVIPPASFLPDLHGSFEEAQKGPGIVERPAPGVALASAEAERVLSSVYPSWLNLVDTGRAEGGDERGVVFLGIRICWKRDSRGWKVCCDLASKDLKLPFQIAPSGSGDPEGDSPSALMAAAFFAKLERIRKVCTCSSDPQAFRRRIMKLFYETMETSRQSGGSLRPSDLKALLLSLLASVRQSVETDTKEKASRFGEYFSWIEQQAESEVESVNLHGYGLTDSSLPPVVEGLCVMSTLRELLLPYNKYGVSALPALPSLKQVK